MADLGNSGCSLGSMRRFDVREIYEQPWFSHKLRDEVTDALQFIFDTAHLYRPIVSRLGMAIDAAGTDRVIDLCSGAGGRWFWLQKMIAIQVGKTIQVT